MYIPVSIVDKTAMLPSCAKIYRTLTTPPPQESIGKELADQQISSPCLDSAISRYVRVCVNVRLLGVDR